MTFQETGRGMDVGWSRPVDDRTYNILQALTSTLEAMDAYEVYASEGDDGLFATLLESHRRNAERLVEALRDRLNARRP